MKTFFVLFPTSLKPLLTILNWILSFHWDLKELLSQEYKVLLDAGTLPQMPASMFTWGTVAPHSGLRTGPTLGTRPFWWSPPHTTTTASFQVCYLPPPYNMQVSKNRFFSRIRGRWSDTEVLRYKDYHRSLLAFATYPRGLGSSKGRLRNFEDEVRGRPFHFCGNAGGREVKIRTWLQYLHKCGIRFSTIAMRSIRQKNFTCSVSYKYETLNISRTIETFPPTFEELDQEHGFVLYQHKIASYNRDPSLLDLTDSVRDRAMVYVNKQRAATLTRAEIETSPIGGGLRPGKDT